MNYMQKPGAQCAHNVQVMHTGTVFIPLHACSVTQASQTQAK